MKNGLKCTHLATGYPVDIPLNYKEMQLAMDKSDKQNDSWEIMCALVLDRCGIDHIESEFSISTHTPGMPKITELHSYIISWPINLIIISQILSK